jgi:hypothetical protein
VHIRFAPDASQAQHEAFGCETQVFKLNRCLKAGWRTPFNRKGRKGFREGRKEGPFNFAGFAEFLRALYGSRFWVLPLANQAVRPCYHEPFCVHFKETE